MKPFAPETTKTCFAPEQEQKRTSFYFLDFFKKEKPKNMLQLFCSWLQLVLKKKKLPCLIHSFIHEHSVSESVTQGNIPTFFLNIILSNFIPKLRQIACESACLCRDSLGTTRKGFCKQPSHFFYLVGILFFTVSRPL